MAEDALIVRGAREHNLRNVDVSIPRDRLTVITGLSGSGKSSLAFDTIYAEGQRRFLESLSAWAKRFVDQLKKPAVDFIYGLSPVISIEQKTVSRNRRSTVGTMADVYDYVSLRFAITSGLVIGEGYLRFRVSDLWHATTETHRRDAESAEVDAEKTDQPGKAVGKRERAPAPGVSASPDVSSAPSPRPLRLRGEPPLS